MTTTVTSKRRLRVPALTLNGYFDEGVFRAGGEGVNPPISDTYDFGLLTTSITKGDKILDWKARIAEGRNATTYLSVNAIRVRKARQGTYSQIPSGTFCSSGNPKTGGVSGWMAQGNLVSEFSLPDSYFPYIDETEASNKAAVAYNNKVISVHRKVLGGEVLSDLVETLHMIRHPGKKLFEGIGEHIKSVKKRVKRIPKSRRASFLSETYLESVFGWGPLLSDVKSGAEALAEYKLKRRTDVYCVGKGKTEELMTPGTLYSRLLPHSTCIKLNSRVAQKKVCEVTYRGKVEVDPYAQPVMASELLGFDLASFAPTAWEILPYSFLVDYFANIGDIINAWSANTANVKWTSKTVYKAYVKYIAEAQLDQAYSNAISCSGPLPPGVDLGVLASSPREELEVEHVSIERHPIASGVVIPDFQLRLPSVVKHGLSMKWLNLGALAHCKLSKPLY